MTRFFRADWIIFGLALLAAVQLCVLGFSMGSGKASSRSWFLVGDTLSGIRAFDSQGREVSFAGIRPTLLLVFHSECGQCQGVAPLWRDWTETPDPDLRVVVLSAEPTESAEEG